MPGAACRAGSTPWRAPAGNFTVKINVTTKGQGYFPCPFSFSWGILASIQGLELTKQLRRPKKTIAMENVFSVPAAIS
jgi:hypothetical protein